MNGSIYHSSGYAAKTDQEWAEMRAEIVKQYAEDSNKILEESEQLKGL